jgi:hypothetical protein
MADFIRPITMDVQTRKKRFDIVTAVKLVSVIAATLLAQGCVGIVTRHMETKTFEPAIVAKKPATYSVGERSVESGNDPSNESPTSLWVKQSWGPPSQIKQVTRPTEDELWIYNFDHKWCGIMPCVIVPIPLLLPVGTERVIFHIREGRVTSAEVTTLGGYQAVAGIGSDGPTAISGRWK